MGLACVDRFQGVLPWRTRGGFAPGSPGSKKGRLIEKRYRDSNRRLRKTNTHILPHLTLSPPPLCPASLSLSPPSSLSPPVLPVMAVPQGVLSIVPWLCASSSMLPTTGPFHSHLEPWTLQALSSPWTQKIFTLQCCTAPPLSHHGAHTHTLSSSSYQANISSHD